MGSKYLVDDSLAFVFDIKQPKSHVAADSHIKAEVHCCALAKVFFNTIGKELGPTPGDEVLFCIYREALWARLDGHWRRDFVEWQRIPNFVELRPRPINDHS